ncbi:hypothetical protein FA15DRAFT_681788 [Coprinopsis marcescibilis]|uniref:Uncharacterized protein n=1 Tax=Coprinopsis marcescibilis TaxID=230819 RepID=A0A5C3L1V3_COPMA|nr:hypothetical protein FA15DRAFT_681788 [Coprinopsis marcescibilis]
MTPTLNVTQSRTRTSSNRHFQRNWPDFTISTTAPSQTVDVPLDSRPVSQALWLGVQVYAFLGLAFFSLVVLGSLVWYFYVIIYRRKIQDMPNDLEKDEDLKRASQNLPRKRVFTIEAYTSRPERQKALEMKRQREEALAEALASQDLGKDSKKRISWASSIATVQNERRHPDSVSLFPGLKRRPSSMPPPSASSDKPLKGILRKPSASFHEISAGGTIPEISEISQAHTEPPRSKTHIENRSLVGSELIGTTTAQDCASWAGAGATCGCQDIDRAGQKPFCRVHGLR